RLGLAWRMVLRNLFRNRRRTAIGVVAAAMATSLLVTGTLAHRSVVELVDFQYRKIQRSDLDLSFRDHQGLDALLEARRLPGGAEAEPALEVGCTFRNGVHRKRAGIRGIARGSRLSNPRDADGRPVPIPPEGLVLGRALAEKLRVKPGDEV